MKRLLLAFLFTAGICMASVSLEPKNNRMVKQMIAHAHQKHNIPKNEIVLGNVNKSSLEEIWNGKEYEDLRKMHITGKFPKGHKCIEKCDQVKLFEYLKK